MNVQSERRPVARRLKAGAGGGERKRDRKPLIQPDWLAITLPFTSSNALRACDRSAARPSTEAHSPRLRVAGKQHQQFKRRSDENALDRLRYGAGHSVHA